MSSISFTPVTDGSTATAASVNTPLSTIYNDYNGNITNVNIAANAAIAGSKINYTSVANPYKFSVYLSSAQSTVNGVATRIAFDGLDYDTGSNVDRTTNKGRFTAPVAGFYRFDASMNLPLNGTANIQLLLYKNGSLAKQLDSIATTGASNVYGSTLKGGNDLQLAANDYVEVFFFCPFVVAITTGSAETWFSGFFLSAT